jgi:CheY-like chemotaxis protein
LVELHGGTIHAESAGRGRGSRFSFTLPINTTVRPEHPGITPNYAGLKDPHSLLNKKILIVDDELDIREVLRGFLEDCGATVSTASSAKEALEKALEADFDLVLSDISMPNRDGYALIEDLRRLKPSPPVIALTAYASEQAKLRALTAGFVAHVAKPVELSELLEVVLSSVSQRPNTANHG